MIGVIMLLIPGLLLVNSIKEMFNRDIVTGLYRFVDAVFVAVDVSVTVAECILCDIYAASDFSSAADAADSGKRT